jgi:DNA-binding MarR family transcriptional regulator
LDTVCQLWPFDANTEQINDNVLADFPPLAFADCRCSVASTISLAVPRSCFSLCKLNLPQGSNSVERTHVLAESHYRLRRRRDSVFGMTDLFGEPAWDVLIDLYLAHLDRRAVSVSSACIAACVPPTTGLRYLTRLERNGLLSRKPDPTDNRRVLVSLTASAVELVERTLIGEP